MNIITGSSGGLGKSVYKLFLDNKLPVLGIDKVPSDTCDLTLDFLENTFEDLGNIVNKKNIDSITFCHAIGNSIEEISKYNLTEYLKINALSNLDMYNYLKKNMNQNTSLVLISSIHGVSSNMQSNKYALSKSLLESVFKMMSLEENPESLTLLRLGAINTEMLEKNVVNIESLINSIPAKKILQPDEIASLIFDIHTKYSSLMNKSILQIDGGVLLKLATD